MNNSPGTIIVINKIENNKFLPLNSTRANAYAARIVKTTDAAVEKNPTISEFPNVFQNKPL